jgi:electron transfer flavoprotein beta subunit
MKESEHEKPWMKEPSMKIVVILRQVPDLIEPLELNANSTALDMESAALVLNESDDHALEQALLLKEKSGATITVVAIDCGDVDNVLYTAAAKGVDRVVKIGVENGFPSPRQAAAIYAAAIAPMRPELVLVGVQAHDELDGVLSAFLAARLNMPYLGVIRGVSLGAEPHAVTVCKEFPGAVMARYSVVLPAVLGILGAEQPPRYVPVSRIRAAMKSTEIEEVEGAAVAIGAGTVRVRNLHPPVSGARAEMLTGTPSEIAARIAEILAEKGLLR